MLAGLVLVGFNHKIAPIALRERFACAPERLGTALPELAQQIAAYTEEGAADIELVWLSTCNRTEVYLFGQDSTPETQVVIQYLAQRAGMPPQDLTPFLYTLNGTDAVEHLLTVAAGLDSLVVGENEILGQVKLAYEVARKAGTTGSFLAGLFRQAIRTGKRVRSQTEIGLTSHSIAQVVTYLAEKIFDSLDNRTALLIGAGKISALTARALVAAGLHCVLVTNRTYERAERLAQSLGADQAQAVHFEALGDFLKDADIVISSTSAPHIVLHTQVVTEARQHRQGRPLLIADLAVPRDVDPAVGILPGVQLVDIDSLDSLVQEYFPLSTEVRATTEDLVAAGVSEFVTWCAERSVAPLICALRTRAETICQHEVDTTLRKMGEVTPEQRRSIEAMGKAIIAKLLHAPITSIKEHPDTCESGEYVQVIRQLFRLN